LVWAQAPSSGAASAAGPTKPVRIMKSNNIQVG
jgi:hypothetical protein